MPVLFSSTYVYNYKTMNIGVSFVGLSTSPHARVLNAAGKVFSTLQNFVLIFKVNWAK